MPPEGKTIVWKISLMRSDIINRKTSLYEAELSGIIGKNWRPGSYDRKCFSGDLMQFKYTHRGIHIARSEVTALYEDEEAERLLAAGRIPKVVFSPISRSA